MHSKKDNCTFVKQKQKICQNIVKYTENKPLVSGIKKIKTPAKNVGIVLKLKTNNKNYENYLSKNIECEKFNKKYYY